MWLNKRKEELQINLTPLIDVVFLLLIFFMVSTSFKKETKISLELPQANGEQLEVLPEMLEIKVNKTGDIFINGQGILNRKIETIKASIVDSSSDKNIPVVISADAEAPYQSVISVMDAAGQVGFKNLTLATQNPKQDSNSEQ